jgi:hypothetical protein
MPGPKAETIRRMRTEATKLVRKSGQKATITVRASE